MDVDQLNRVFALTTWSVSCAPPLASGGGNNLNGFKDWEWRKPRPETGLDSRICSKFARQRSRQSAVQSAEVLHTGLFARIGTRQVRDQKKIYGALILKISVCSTTYHSVGSTTYHKVFLQIAFGPADFKISRPLKRCTGFNSYK